MARKPVRVRKRAYTKGDQPFTAADVRVLETMIDYYAGHAGQRDEVVVKARQALRNARELRNRLRREGRDHYLT